MNSRLIRIQTFVVPAANQYPRLRFWHWYNFGSGFYGNDSGVVEVSTNGTTWQAISPTYTGFSGDWTYASVDLSVFAGRTVHLAFHAVDGNGTAQGWYIDDISVVSGTPVFNNPEGFEFGMGDWYAEQGSWQVGQPTKANGPPTNSVGSQAHSGTNCAVTILNANYPSTMNSRFVSPVFTVPAANQYPRLRFWHWYNFGSGFYGSDSGVVELKGTNGTWQAISPAYTGFSGDWTYASVDLSAFAGQTVQLAFHAVDGNATAQGWYVDDISVITGTPVLDNPEGFELGIGDWYAEQGSWQVGQPTKANGPPTNSVGSQAHSGTNCAVTILNANYPSTMNSRFISPPLTLPPASSSPYLRFWHWYNFGSGFYGSDYGEVQIKAGTNAWQTLASSHYTGSSGGWSWTYFDLTSFGGQMVQLGFHAVDGNGIAQGWYVDDIGIYSSGAPVFDTLPASQTNAVGATATLNVSASGDLPLSYQWRFNSNPIVGATNPMLTLANLQLTQTGYYDVVVTNDAGSITSTPPAFLDVVIAFAGTDIGDPGAAGSFGVSNGVYTVNGSGEGTDGSADVFFFASQPLPGSAQIIARLRTLQGGDPQSAEAGVMIRESLDSGSKEVSLSVNASTNVIFRRRLATNDTGIATSFRGTNYLQATDYLWLRLMRMGNTFVAHYSIDGTNWQYMWFTTLSMSSQVQVGLAVTAHHYGQLATATFDNVYIGGLTPVSGVWPQSGPELLLGGQDWSPAELQRIGGFEFLLGGVVGDYFTIKGSTNVATPLGSWWSFGTVTNVYGVVPVLDAGALTNSQRYYRAQRLGP
ncbi:MAG TPA: choice-of-anchor J domain-containing protein [Verrucomicrobiae bacterium]|nr:choice-of-anchor J domain-containing protein [Verrucomicrobiae bacterium]